MLGILASIAAVVAVVLTGWQLHHDLKQKSVEQWEDVAVYSVCVQAGYKGATLDEIRAQYQNAAQDLPSDLPREALQTDSIKRAVISLISANAVVLRPDGTYAAVRGPVVPELEFEHHKTDKIATFIVAIVRQSPHTFTEDQLRLSHR